jgi:hypothetical protein
MTALIPGSCLGKADAGDLLRVRVAVGHMVEERLVATRVIMAAVALLLRLAPIEVGSARDPVKGNFSGISVPFLGLFLYGSGPR